jgi:hypothetical protein
MDNPKEPPGPEVRRTLKLKSPSNKAKLTAPRARPAVAPAPRPASNSPQSRESGTWADVYKKKMQEDMDALGFGEDLSTRVPPRR